MKRSSRALMWLLAGLLPAADGAEDQYRTEPVHLRAQRIEIDQRKGVTRYIGKVDLRQAEMHITAATAETKSTDNNLTRVTVEGSPVTFRDIPPDQEAPVEGTAQRLLFEADQQRVHLYGQVEIRQNDDEVHADVMHYDMAQEVVQAEYDGTVRPYAIIKPRRQLEKAPADSVPVKKP